MNGGDIADFPLFDAYPPLGRALPRTPLGHWPTPITPATRFAAEMGWQALNIKREDRSHPVCGGNKLRGLEFLLADVLRKRCRVIVTFGAAGSHHVARTAWHAADHGIRTIALVVRQPMAAYVRRNIALALSAGADVRLVNPLTFAPRLAWAYCSPSHWRGSRPPAVILPGGTTPLACVGHVNAAFELRQQVRDGAIAEPDYLFVPLGSLGTAAGLLLGLKLAGLRTRVVGVVTSYAWFATAARVARLARRTLALLQRVAPAVPNVPLAAGDLDVIGTSLGAGYAHFTPESIRLAERLRALDGVELDGTYGAKTLAGAVEFVRQRELQDRQLLFWHTYAAAQPGSDSRPHPGGSLGKFLAQPDQPLAQRPE